jgi:hypothetical protein
LQYKRLHSFIIFIAIFAVYVVLSISEFEVCLARESAVAVSLEEMKASHYTLVIIFPT